MIMRAAAAVATAALAIAVLILPVYAAADGSTLFIATLEPQNGTGATGSVKIVVRSDSMTVRIEARGLLPDAAHLQGLVGFAEGSRDAACPTAAADRDGDGFVSSREAQSVYGPGIVGLLPRTDEASSPRADENGVLRYARTFDLAKVTDEFNNDFARGLVDDLDRFVVSQGGVDRNGNGRIDLFRETATLATCGELLAAPQGGVDAGNGSTAGVERMDLLAAGGGLVAVAAGILLVVARRRAADQPGGQLRRSTALARSTVRRNPDL